MEIVRSNQDIYIFFSFIFIYESGNLFFFHSRYVLSEIDELYVGYD